MQSKLVRTLPLLLTRDLPVIPLWPVTCALPSMPLWPCRVRRECANANPIWKLREYFYYDRASALARDFPGRGCTSLKTFASSI